MYTFCIFFLYYTVINFYFTSVVYGLTTLFIFTHYTSYKGSGGAVPPIPLPLLFCVVGGWVLLLWCKSEVYNLSSMLYISINKIVKEVAITID